MGCGTGSGSGPDDDLSLLSPHLHRVIREAGGYGGGVFLLAPGEHVLRLAVVCGIPMDVAGPWSRVGLDVPVPLTRAVNERRLVWQESGRHDRRGPRVSVPLPYSYAVAHAPITTTDGTAGSEEAEEECWGVLMVLWPGSHPSQLAPHEREPLEAGCRRLGPLLRDAARRGCPVRLPEEPTIIERPRTRMPEPEQALAATDFAERLPEGACALALDGRVAFVTERGAALLGANGAELLGARLWEAVPWLADPSYEDRFRSAVISRQPTSFTARRATGHWLRFELHPGDRGVSLRLSPARAPAEEPPEPRGEPPPAGPTRVGAIYQVMRLAVTLTEAAGVADVVRLVADQLLPAFDAQGLILCVTEGDRLRVVGHRGCPPEIANRLDGTPLTSRTSPTAAAMSEGVPTYYASPDEMRRRFPHIPDAQEEVAGPGRAKAASAAWAFLPLVTSGRVAGCAVIFYDRPHDFTAEERTLLTSLAGVVAQALERARLFDANQRLARRLQKDLLPRDLPSIPGLDVAARYLAATKGMEIGGDFYDVIELDGGAGATIGDVQGHNVTAAALMGQVRTAVHAAAGTAPSEVLTRTNRLLNDLDPGLFTSCLYVHLDLRRRLARLATAGHPPPLLRMPDGRITEVDVPPGPVLGVDPRADYPAVEIPLPPGAVLLLFTDGLIERPGVHLDDATAALAGHFGRIAEQPERSMDELAETLLRSHQTGGRGDDIALLLLSPRG
ncbi:SpoIIE family protein phosphatase [Streptomyces millisiae]|uniref:SpoIIE family protein phosphatase n=1 Tax=Streptomyces millisiae TaxID=3075542 RepID=A0ABU2LLT0_9ACTN|nr:SpoIIE family protein phosphatase [Streptomyces sp. DSM 44918]MDT0318013.1 SpoIIE family protein phosphatase [Streptomyces sp. DSM 44918]